MKKDVTTKQRGQVISRGYEAARYIGEARGWVAIPGQQHEQPQLDTHKMLGPKLLAEKGRQQVYGDNHILRLCHIDTGQK